MKKTLPLLLFLVCSFAYTNDYTNFNDHLWSKRIYFSNGDKIGYIDNSNKRNLHIVYNGVKYSYSVNIQKNTPDLCFINDDFYYVDQINNTSLLNCNGTTIFSADQIIGLSSSVDNSLTFAYRVADNWFIKKGDHLIYSNITDCDYIKDRIDANNVSYIFTQNGMMYLLRNDSLIGPYASIKKSGIWNLGTVLIFFNGFTKEYTISSDLKTIHGPFNDVSLIAYNSKKNNYVISFCNKENNFLFNDDHIYGPFDFYTYCGLTTQGEIIYQTIDDKNDLNVFVNNTKYNNHNICELEINEDICFEGYIYESNGYYISTKNITHGPFELVSNLQTNTMRNEFSYIIKQDKLYYIIINNSQKIGPFQNEPNYFYINDYFIYTYSELGKHWVITENNKYGPYKNTLLVTELGKHFLINFVDFSILGKKMKMPNALLDGKYSMNRPGIAGDSFT